jgi:hypothetical protein
MKKFKTFFIKIYLTMSSFPLKLFDINNFDNIYQSQIAIKYDGCFYNLIKIYEIYTDNNSGNNSGNKKYKVQYLNKDFDVIVETYMQNINVRLYLENYENNE